MDKVYIIVAEYGQWSDSTSDDMFVHNMESVAIGTMKSIAEEFLKAYRQILENIAHGASVYDLPDEINQHVADVAIRSYHDEGVRLAMYSMPFGQVTFRREYMSCINLSLYPEGWDYDRVAREGKELFATKYELMAEPYEHKYGA